MGLSLVLPCTHFPAMFPRRTQEELKRLEKNAADCFILRIEADDPDSIVLLEALKQNPNVCQLQVNRSARIRRDVVYALADCLATNHFIKKIIFEGDFLRYLAIRDAEPPVRDKGTTDEYATLIKAISASPSLQIISIEYDILPELEEAVLESLKRKTTFTTLRLNHSSLVMNNPAAFGELLATSKGLCRLELVDSKCYDTHGHALQDGLRRSGSLKEVLIKAFPEMDVNPDMFTTIKCICEGLDGNQSLEKLSIESDLDSTVTMLLTKLVSRHKKLASLSIDTSGDPDASSTFLRDDFTGLCDAVAHSESMKEFFVCHCSCISAVSRMLEQTHSLQKLFLASQRNYREMEKLSVGLKACKTLTTLSANSWEFDMKGTSAFLETVIINQNITEIIPPPKLSPYGDYAKWEKERSQVGEARKQEEEVRRQENEVLKKLKTELKFYLAFNKQGRLLLGADVPSSVWPYALAKAGRSSLPDAMYFFLQEAPELVMSHSV